MMTEMHVLYCMTRSSGVWLRLVSIRWTPNTVVRAIAAVPAYQGWVKAERSWIFVLDGTRILFSNSR